MSDLQTYSPCELCHLKKNQTQTLYLNKCDWNILLWQILPGILLCHGRVCLAGLCLNPTARLNLPSYSICDACMGASRQRHLMSSGSFSPDTWLIMLASAAIPLFGAVGGWVFSSYTQEPSWTAISTKRPCKIKCLLLSQPFTFDTAVWTYPCTHLEWRTWCVLSQGP